MPSRRLAIFLSTVAILGWRLPPLHGATPPAPTGLWQTSRYDASNQARTEAVAQMNKPPQELWRRETGGVVGFARTVRAGGSEALLILVGNVLELRRFDGATIWRNARLGVTSVLRIANVDARDGEEVFALADARTLLLLDLETGRQLWTWRSDPSTFINGYKFHETSAGIRFICFPSYSLEGYCFDFSANRAEPRLVWRQSYGGKYDAGYGPAIVLKDMDGDGAPDIVLSGKNPHVYHAVIDINTGAIKLETTYEAESGSPVHLGRPYGLLHAAAFEPGQPPSVALLSCQVEEFIAVSKNSGGALRRLWGKYVEKDWPEDHLELRPQATSLADLTGEGLIELVIGVWDGGRWSTHIIDPRVGFDAKRASLNGRYFWGCYDFDGDGSAEIVVSDERSRRPARATTIEILSGKSLQPLATLDNASVFASSDSPLPDDVSFMALRRNPVFVSTAAGDRGILVQRSDDAQPGTYFWAPLAAASRGLRHLAESGVARADLGDADLLLSDSTGKIQRFDLNLNPLGEKLAAIGRECQPLVWANGDVVELITDVAGGTLIGGRPDLERSGEYQSHWQVGGSMAAAHRDSAGQSRLVAADLSDADHPAALIYTAPLEERPDPLRIELSNPAYLGLLPYGDDFHLLVNLQRGVHTMALACYDAAGALQWEDRKQGAHPRLPAAADVNSDGQWEVIADDHGMLRIYDSAGRVTATDSRWPPAYTIPIIGPFHSPEATSIFRASGISGLALLDNQARHVWLTPTPIWRHFHSISAVAQLDDQRWSAGSLAEDGNFECIDVADGALRWSLDLHAAPAATSIIAGSIDDAPGDEFLLGLPDGRLVCITETNGQGAVLWEKSFDAAVANPIIADLDSDGAAEIVISTSDGFVRILGGE